MGYQIGRGSPYGRIEFNQITCMNTTTTETFLDVFSSELLESVGIKKTTLLGLGYSPR